MKIAIVITSLEVGGAEKMILELAKSLQNDIKIKLFIIKKNFNSIYDQEAKALNIDIIYLNNRSKLFSISIAKKLKAKLNDYGPDIIHSNLKSSSYILYYHLFSNRDFKWVHTVHSISRVDTRFLRKIIFKKLYNSKKIKLIAVSKYVYDTLLIDYKKCDCEIITNGIDLKNYYISNANYERIYICHIGRFVRVKNHKYIIKEFQKLARLKDDIYMYFIGEGPLMKRMKQKVKKMNLENRIIFIGYTNRIKDYLRKSHIFILPSQYEGLSISLIEAMASGLICITSKASSGIIDNNINGYIIDLKKDHLAIKMLEVVNSYPLLNNVRKMAVEKSREYGIENMKNRYLKLYESL